MHGQQNIKKNTELL